MDKQLNNKINKKIRIAMLGHKRIPSRNGGIEKVLTELCPRLVSHGAVVTAFNREGEPILPGDLTASDGMYKGVYLKNVLTFHGKGLAAVSASFFGALGAAFGHYDIVHFHAEGPSAMIWLPKFFGKTCIVTVHGLDWKRDKWKNGFGAHYIRFGERMLAKYADEIIVLNEETQHYFKQMYGRSTVFIPNGINSATPTTAKLITRKFRLTGDDYFLSVSRLTPEKGVHKLIQAFRQLKTNVKLVIAGGTSDSDDYVEYLHRLAMEDKRIIFTGFVTGETLHELYSNAYVYVLSSEVEGMPMTLLEAMAVGNAVACSRIPEITEVVGNEHALQFSINNQAEIVRVLQRFLDEPELRDKMRRTSATFVTSKYDWDNISERTLALYHEVLIERNK